MAHDKNAAKSQPEPNSPRDENIVYSDWVTDAGSLIETSINTKIWPESLLASFQQTAPLILDDILSEFESAEACVSLYLCDDSKIQQLNNEYRRMDKPTNVLSFPAHNVAEQKIDWGTRALLGDIVIAAETVKREANDMQMPVIDHLLHLFVHGMLHLFGYDHVDDDLAVAMESLEVKFLAKIGVPNPYRSVHLGASS